MFNTIRDFIYTRRLSVEAKRHYANVKRKTERLVASRARADREAVSQLASAVDGIKFVLVSWLKTPSTKPASTVAFDLFTASLMRGVAAGSDDVACYLSLKAERARDEETRTAETQHLGVELARIVGDALMREGQGYEIEVRSQAVALEAAAVINEQLLQDTEVTVRDGTVYLTVKAGAESSNCAKPQGSRVAEIIGIVHMSEGKLCSFLVDPQDAQAIASLILKHCSRPVVIEDGDVPGKSHLVVRDASAKGGGGESVH